MKNVPDRVYVQFWGDIERPEDEMYDPNWEVTWCDDQENDSDICYVREDKRDAEIHALYAPVVEKLEKLVECGWMVEGIYREEWEDAEGQVRKALAAIKEVKG